MSTTRSARASGKVILFGEHAVVYGVPAIAAGIDRGVVATARELEPGEGSSRLTIEGVTIRADDADQDLGRALSALLEASGEAAQGRAFDLGARAELPPGGGLGCSAALGVALARAIDPRAQDDAVEARAMAWEKVFHGNPSGIDAAVATRGGCVYFERGCPIEPVRASRALVLCVGHCGAASSTKAMVESVARLRERRPEVVGKTFEGIRAIVRNARLAIEAGDRLAIGRLMDLNQMLLSGLFVSTPEIERMCGAARDAGARGAKLTGAGGGGSVVALADDVVVAERVLAAWRAEGFEGFVAGLAGMPPPSLIVRPTEEITS